MGNEISFEGNKNKEHKKMSCVLYLLLHRNENRFRLFKAISIYLTHSPSYTIERKTMILYQNSLETVFNSFVYFFCFYICCFFLFFLAQVRC